MTDRVRIVSIGVDHTAMDGAFREGIAETWDAAVSDAVSSGAATSGVALRTCLRVEAYLAATEPGRCADAVAERVAARSGIARGTVDARLSVRSGQDGVAHLFSLAAGLESVIVGERQILDQIRDAWGRARALRPLDARLDRLFQHAVATGKRVRRDTEIGCGGRSVAGTAADLVRAGVTDLGAAMVTLVGAGTVARDTALAVGGRGGRTFVVVNRSRARAADLAADLAGQGWACKTVPWSDRAEAAAAADVIICATSAPGQVLRACDLTDGRRRLVVDLARPCDVDPGVARLRGATLIDLDALWRHARVGSTFAPSELTKARAIVDDRVEGYLRWLAEREAAPAIAQLMRRRHAESSTDMRRALHDQTIALKRRAFERAGLPLVPDTSRG